MKLLRIHIRERIPEEASMRGKHLAGEASLIFRGVHASSTVAHVVRYPQESPHGAIVEVYCETTWEEVERALPAVLLRCEITSAVVALEDAQIKTVRAEIREED